MHANGFVLSRRGSSRQTDTLELELMAGNLPILFDTPYKREFSGGITVGTKIKVKGRIEKNANGFHLKLASGKSSGDDVQLDFNPQLNDRRISISSYHKPTILWKTEGVTINSMPFARSDGFDMVVECKLDAYEITVDEEIIAEYEHRLPLQSVRYLLIDGDVTLNDVTDTVEGSNNDISHVKLPEGQLVGTKVIVCGVPVRAYPHKMMIDFTTDTDPTEIAFHFNPRFYDMVLVRNTFDGVWGNEERKLLQPFPFVYGVGFKLTFIIKEDRFVVLLNGNFLCNYMLRKFPADIIRRMNISGSVTVKRVKVCSP